MQTFTDADPQLCLECLRIAATTWDPDGGIDPVAMMRIAETLVQYVKTGTIPGSQVAKLVERS